MSHEMIESLVRTSGTIDHDTCVMRSSNLFKDIVTSITFGSLCPWPWLFM